MTDKNHGKSAGATGSPGSIGRTVASPLARDGFAVVVNLAGNTAKAEEVVSNIKAVSADSTKFAPEPHFRRTLPVR